MDVFFFDPAYGSPAMWTLERTWEHPYIHGDSWRYAIGTSVLSKFCLHAYCVLHGFLGIRRVFFSTFRVWVLPFSFKHTYQLFKYLAALNIGLC